MFRRPRREAIVVLGRRCRRNQSGREGIYSLLKAKLLHPLFLGQTSYTSCSVPS
uniref:Uncharacterized protein n=1 Tax=Arundo donax TaxID=35708 RepID=A0A0A9DRT3_ARUDO